MKLAVSSEIRFQTARSGGKGGQHVNKVETMVEGYFSIADSQLFTAEQKQRLLKKLSGKLTTRGILRVKSQMHRSQLQNKSEVIRRIQALLETALKPEKKRVPTTLPKKAVEQRLASKKKKAEQKKVRKSWRPDQE